MSMYMVFICMHVCVFTFVYVYVYVYVYVFMYICVQVYMFICIYVCMYACICAYMYICIYAYMSVYMFICIVRTELSRVIAAGHGVHVESYPVRFRVRGCQACGAHGLKRFELRHCTTSRHLVPGSRCRLI